MTELLNAYSHRNNFILKIYVMVPVCRAGASALWLKRVFKAARRATIPKPSGVSHRLPFHKNLPDFESRIKAKTLSSNMSVKGRIARHGALVSYKYNKKNSKSAQKHKSTKQKKRPAILLTSGFLGLGHIPMIPFST